MRKIGRFAAGIIVLVLGALMIAEAVTSTVANTPFMFLEGVNRGFEFVIGFVAILLAASVIDALLRSHHSHICHSRLGTQEAGP